ncbi:Type VII secretion system protein eccB1 [Mycobacterium basiliense]|uniref:Type VII secretion system protein eccB1 n=1 Tax=Mycobacterium basiliense TaxID=2094119 RepID=A0A447GAK0_9MYCO|nr:type VII secretion protein EccB [Mycobacterium basiliense]VDM87422.1 Type VII secretion system protein eccB1 [Mycobacterium basiliense]
MNSGDLGLQVSAHRFVVRRLEAALLHRDPHRGGGLLWAPRMALMFGCVLTTIAVAGCAIVAVLRPQPQLSNTQIAMARESGALYVRVGDTWHPVLNLASARLITATNASPRPVRQADLRHAKRGPLLGIPGAPQLVGQSLAVDESKWTICDSDHAASTIVVVGPTAESSVRRLAAEQSVLVAAGPGAPTYLLVGGHRAVADLTDPAVVRALRLEGATPRRVSKSLLDALPEAPSLTVPRIKHAGRRGVAGLARFTVGNVLRITRSEGDEFYVVLEAGLQRIGRVTADLLRFSDSHGSPDVITVAPDVIRAAPIVTTLPGPALPDAAPTPLDDHDATLCVGWNTGRSGHPDTALLAGDGLPVPDGQAAVTMAQADGPGPALDGIYLPHGRNAYVISHSLSGDGARAGWRYLVTETGVRFPIHDDDAAHDLGLADAVPAPWPMLATLPSGPELSRTTASVAHDAVWAGPAPAP